MPFLRLRGLGRKPPFLPWKALCWLNNYVTCYVVKICKNDHRNWVSVFPRGLSGHLWKVVGGRGQGSQKHLFPEVFDVCLLRAQS